MRTTMGTITKDRIRTVVLRSNEFKDISMSWRRMSNVKIVNRNRQRSESDAVLAGQDSRRLLKNGWAVTTAKE